MVVCLAFIIISVDLKLFLGPRQRFFARPSELLYCCGNNDETIFLDIDLSSLSLIV